MKRPAVRSVPPLPGVIGPARVGRPTHRLVPRLSPGDIAVLDHQDLDGTTADALIAAGVRAVLNARAMFSGRYANRGPLRLADGGVVIVENIGMSAYARLADNPEVIRVHDGNVFLGTELVVAGHELARSEIEASMAAADEGLEHHLTALTHNSAELARRDHALLLEGVGLPRLATTLPGRPALVIGQAQPAEIARLRTFVRGEDPVICAVDGAAERLRAHRLQPDVVVVSDADRIPSSRVLRGARDVVVTGAESDEIVAAVARLGISPVVVRSAVGPDEIALLLAHHGGCSTIVGAGLPATLGDLLDHQRPGLAGTFLTRLVVGPSYVDAHSVSRLYTGRVRPWHVAATGVVAAFALLASIASTPMGQAWLEGAGWR